MPTTTNNAARALALVAHAAAIFIFTSVASAGVATSPVITAVYTTYSATGVPTNLNITGTGLCSTATCTTKPVVKLAGVAQTVTGGTSTGVGVKLGVIADGDYVLNITVGSYSANYNLTIKSGGTGSGGTATVSVGTTTTGAVGTSASVTNSGTTTAAILNFTIPRGDQGPAGTPGTQGPMGLPGVQGPQGVPGPTGQTGQTGASGPMGLQGPAGADGAQGPVGPAGAKGDKGDTGEAGAAGTDGKGLTFKGAWLVGTTYAPLDVVTQDGSSFIAVAGSTDVSPTVDVAENGGNWAMLAAKGAEGPQGPAGTDGTAGSVGPQGPAGKDGEPGAIGPQGPAGAAGATGAAGRDGADGLPGLPGIAGLPGAPGPQGPIGPQGPAGAEGPTGPQGTPGATGATGATGAAGVGVNARGAWSASVTYQANDLVSYGGATYIATATTASGGAGYSQIVNIDWIANATTDANGTSFPSGASTIRLNLPAGTYTATPIGPSQGGAYTSGQFCTCNISQGVPSWWWGFNYRTSANPTPTRVQGVNGFWTAPEALAAATPITITLAADGWVEFLLVDTPIGDNTNGVSLLLTAPGTSAATPDQDSAHWAVFAAAGATGPAGPAGSDGSQGPAGATGATGAQGPAGPAGATGATGFGLQGPPGQSGPAGPEGPQGPKGDKGDTGTPGSVPTASTTGAILYWGGTSWKEISPPSTTGTSLIFCANGPIWASACPVTPPAPTAGAINLLVEASASIAGLLPSVGQDRVRLVPLKSGRTVVSYSNVTGPPAQAWHFVMNASGIQVNPQLTAASLDALSGLNLGSSGSGLTRGVPFSSGQSAIFGLNYSGYGNGTGGYAARIDSAGNASIFGGTGWYETHACAIGTEAFLVSLLVDPVAHQVQGYANAAGAANTSLQSLPDYGQNYWGRTSVACGTGTTAGNYAVLSRNNPNVAPTRIGLTQYSVSSHLWTKVGTEQFFTVPTVAGAYIASDIAMADQNGVIAYVWRGTDGRRQTYLVRFKMSAGGIQLVDTTPVSFQHSASREGLGLTVISASCTDPSVGCSAGDTFYLAHQQGGSSATGQSANASQVITLYSMDFSTGTTSSLASYTDTQASGSNISAATSGNQLGNLALSCDGNLYYGTTMDAGTAKTVLKVFSYRITDSNTCVP